MNYLKNKIHDTDPLWHVQLALAIAVVIQLLLPSDLIAFPHYVVPGLIVVCMIGLQILTPKTAVYTSPPRRLFVLLLIAAIAVASITSLKLLLDAMLHASSEQAPHLLVAAAGIYFTNIIAFALMYWEMDNGGPGKRRKPSTDDRDFLFPQQDLGYKLSHRWEPTFIDYLYVSITNATAFSPTDTMPLSRRAKTVMGIQAFTSLIIVVLIAARAINIL